MISLQSNGAATIDQMSFSQMMNGHKRSMGMSFGALDPKEGSEGGGLYSGSIE